MDDKVQKTLHELFSSYAKNLPIKMTDIARQWSSLLAKWDLEHFLNFHRDIHSLSASTTTYGYKALSKKIRELEIYLKAFLGKEDLNVNQKERITELLGEIKTAFVDSQPQNPPKLESIVKEPSRNKLVYILETDEVLLKELEESLKHLNYESNCFFTLESLLQAIHHKPPIAVVADTSFLEKAASSTLDKSIRLFCIVPDDHLQPRLTAIRAGSDAFFQKPIDVSYLTQVLDQKCSTPIDDPYRILIIDDSKSLGDYYSLILKNAGMVPYAISNPLETLSVLNTFQPDLLLIDYYLPECTGVELANVLRQESLYAQLPIIFLSSDEEMPQKLSAMQISGDDIITKTASAECIVAAVRARAKRAGLLNYYMTMDNLTGLLNHASILRRLESEMAHAKQRQLPLAFMVVSIDHFKLINDSYGHLVGELVIKKLATFMLLRLRSQDIIGRFNEEEFAIILPGANKHQGRVICDVLRKQFAQMKFFANKIEFNVTFSGGITYFSDEKDTYALVNEAVQALEKAKENGKNQVIAYNPYFT